MLEENVEIDEPLAIPAVVPAILAEIDTEIALRGRLEETLRTRIEWALTLKATLQNERTRGTVLGGTPQTFQKLSTDALVNAELPSSILFATPTHPNLEQASTNSEPPSSVPFRRAAPRPKPINARKGTFLFVNAQHTTSYVGPPHYLLLRCPVCSKSSFSSLQGLLNHARITHNIEYGTHDACIKACAVENSSMDLDQGVEVGLGPSGVLPGLQTLFERAVGVGGAPLLLPLPEAIVKQESSEAQQEESTTLTRSLGIHGDTAALAPFLGKEARRREIRVYDEDMDVDIGTPQTALVEPPKAWKMSFAQRNVAGSNSAAMDVDTELKEVVQEQSLKETTNASQLVSLEGSAILDRFPSSSGSRFHFSVRVGISDRSLFIPPEKRTNHEHSHKWMINAENPSYAIPLSCVLKNIKVTPLASTEDFELVTDSVAVPPYCIVGTAKQPFLAQVELMFNDVPRSGRSENDPENQEQKMILEHWVDLDPLRTGVVTFGEEQLIDAELDRRTDIKPATTDNTPVTSRKLWGVDGHLQSISESTSKEDPPEATPSPAYTLLLEVAKRFPLVAQGKERNITDSVPYKLVSTRSQFNNLIFGRQQSIRWGRARAIKKAYTSALTEAGLEIPSTISTAEVFLWLQETDKVPLANPAAGGIRPSQAMVKEVSRKPNGPASIKASEWCGFCGLDLALHQPSEAPIEQGVVGDTNRGWLEDMQLSETSEGCALYQRVLFLGLSANDRTHGQRHRDPPILNPISDDPIRYPPSAENFPRYLVQSVDPDITRFVQGVISGMNLATFQNTLSSPIPFDQHGIPRSAIETNLAPHALIALVAQKYVREVIRQGVSYALREQALAVQQLLGSRRGRAATERPRSVLTPHHILAGNRSLARST